MSVYSQEEFYNEESNNDTLHSHSPSIVDEPIAPAPQFCKRISLEEVEANAKLNTHKELLEMGQLMNRPIAATGTGSDIFKIKTMSLKELDEYVEKKLSKDHYSPEVIYLLFKIQTLLIEKQHMTKEIADNDTNIMKLQKRLVDEKALTIDLKDTMKESVCEIETNEKEYKHDIALMNDKFRELTVKHQETMSRKNLYEKILFYIVPFTLLLLVIIGR